MVFPGENVSCGPWKLKRLAAVRGKLAVNGGEVISGDAEWQDHLATRGTKGTKMPISDFVLFVPLAA